MTFAPYTQTIEVDVPATGAGADLSTVVMHAPFAGTITGVTYTPEAAVTGANTNTRTLGVTDTGAAGTGSTSVATLPLTAGTNLTAFVAKPLTLSVVANATTVAQGDGIEFTSIHAGTGIADPGGVLAVTFARVASE